VTFHNGRARSVQERLLNAGVPFGTEPLKAWQQLREAEGRWATIIDLYRLVAEQRGLEPHELPFEERAELARLAMPTIWPEFAVTPGSDRSDPIEVLDYDAKWLETFETWRVRLADVLGEIAKRIEHVGSTAVPGLSAKPTVDIQVSVIDIRVDRSYSQSLERVGLQLRSRDVLHLYFRPFPGRARDVHVHVCNVGSTWEREHLLFRDYLRVHESAREAYAETKRAAALVWTGDRWGYTDAKSETILDILESAKKWATGIGWVP
jgi:GrpB-like predicted nucleotidyltransferase (UPF0157 family)